MRYCNTLLYCMFHTVLNNLILLFQTILLIGCSFYDVKMPFNSQWCVGDAISMNSFLKYL